MKKQKEFCGLKDELEILRELGISVSDMDFLIREKIQEEYRGKL